MDKKEEKQQKQVVGFDPNYKVNATTANVENQKNENTLTESGDRVHSEEVKDVGMLIRENQKLFETIESITISTNRRTGERIGRFTDNTGLTTVQKIGNFGTVISEYTVLTDSRISWRSKQEREVAVKRLLEGKYLQDEVADIVGVSQGTVSNIKKKFEEKENNK